MTDEPEPARYPQVSVAARQMLELGESGRYEFKRDVDVVNAGLLSALANWVASDPAREVAHLLVGVDEVEDKDTGLVYGKPVGLSKGLDRSVSRIQDVAAMTRPVPVDTLIVEEGVAEQIPFVRVEVRPTMPPHFDDQGRRQTRQGRSTRALTDEELLRIYLDREAGSFAMRFQQVSDELRSAVGAVGGQVDQIAEGIENNVAVPILTLTSTAHEAAEAAEMASMSAESAASSADSASFEIERVERLVQGLRETIDDIRDDHPQSLAYRVVQLRRKVWWNFTADTWTHKSKRAVGLQVRLHDLLSCSVALDSDRNIWELQIWRDLLDERAEQRGKHGTQKWWDTAIRVANSFLKDPSYAAPDLPDLRGALRVDRDHEIEQPDSVTNQFLGLIRGK